MTREPNYSEKKSIERKVQKGDLPNTPKRLTRIERAIESTTPGSSLKPASHEEIMEYLRRVLVPALADISVRVGLDLQEESKLLMTKEERKSFSIIWERVSTIVRTRRPRPTDAPLMLIGKLLSDTRSISPSEVHVWTTQHYAPTPIAPPQ